MRISHTGGVIAAASRRDALPMLHIGSIPIISRLVITFQQAGIFPIVVITGAEEEQVKRCLSDHGVIYLPSEHPDQPELFDSVKLGLAYLRGKCDRVVFTPVNAPMFTADTLMRLKNTPGDLVIPTYQGRGGHPVVLSEDVTGDILAYSGGGGLRGAMDAMAERQVLLPVEDRGILSSVHDEQQLRDQLAEHNQALLHPRVRLTFDRESSFFNSRLKLLLFLISDTRNMRKACAAMAISHSKAWSMINELERELGYFVVDRTQGGRHGGNTCLTPRGEAFLLACQQYEEEVFQFAQSRFREMFILSKIM